VRNARSRPDAWIIPQQAISPWLQIPTTRLGRTRWPTLVPRSSTHMLSPQAAGVATFWHPRQDARLFARGSGDGTSYRGGGGLLVLAAATWYWWVSGAEPIHCKTASVDRGPTTSVVIATGTVNPWSPSRLEPSLGQDRQPFRKAGSWLRSLSSPLKHASVKRKLRWKMLTAISPNRRSWRHSLDFAEMNDRDAAAQAVTLTEKIG